MPPNQTVETHIPYLATPFSARGVVEGLDARAEVVGTQLVMHPLVRQRAEELVARNEEFLDANGRRRYSASLRGHDLGTMLTVIRSFDVVLEFTMELTMERRLSAAE